VFHQQLIGVENKVFLLI